MLRRAKAWDENHTSLDAIRITVQPLPSSSHYFGHFGLVTTRNCVQVALHQLCQLCQSDNDLDKSNSIWSLNRVFKGLKKLKSSKCALWNSILETVKMKEPDAWSHLDQDLASLQQGWKKVEKGSKGLGPSGSQLSVQLSCVPKKWQHLFGLCRLCCLCSFASYLEYLEGNNSLSRDVTWCNLRLARFCQA